MYNDISDAWCMMKVFKSILKTSSIQCRDSPINGKIESMTGIYDSQIKSSVDVSKTSDYIVIFFKKRTILRDCQQALYIVFLIFFFFLNGAHFKQEQKSHVEK